MRKLIFAICLFLSVIADAQMVPAEIGNTQNHQPGLSHLEPSVQQSAEHGTLRATIQTDRSNAYVNEQILVTLSVIAPVVAFNITGDELLLDDVDVVSLHREKTMLELDGVPHQRTESTFALFPRNTGVITIPALSFNAVLPVPAESASGAKGNPTISGSTSVVTLSIDPVPAATSPWFPAQNVEVSSGWSLEEGSYELRAGEPVVRQVFIKVSGQHPGAIPQIKPSEQPDVRTYPGSAQLHTEKAVSGLNGTLTQSYTVVASYPGNLTLPAIDIDWWHIDAGEWRTTTLAAEQLQVLASASGGAPSDLVSSRTYKYTLLGMLAVILCLAATCVSLWRKNRRLVLPQVPEKGRTRPTERSTWAALQQSFKKNSPLAIRQSLLQWAGIRWPETRIRRLDQLPLNSLTLRNELGALDEYLFSLESSQAPDFKAMKKALKLERKSDLKAKPSQRELPALYPRA